MDIAEFLAELSERVQDDSVLVVIEVHGTNARMFANVEEDIADAVMLECMLNYTQETVH